MKRLFIAVFLAVLVFGVCGDALAATRDIIPPLTDAQLQAISSKIDGAVTVSVEALTDLTDPDVIASILNIAEDGETFTAAKVIAVLPNRSASLTYNFSANEGAFNYVTGRIDFSVVLAKVTIADGGKYDEDGTVNGTVIFSVVKLNGADDNRHSGGGDGCSAFTLGALLAFAIPLAAVSAKRKVKK